MPSHVAKLVTMTFFLGMVMLASQRAEELAHDFSRSPAAIYSSQKDSVLKPTHSPHLLHTHKVRGPLSAQLQMISPNGVSVGETFVIRGIVTSSDNLQNVLVKWNIPKGLQLINGQIQETITSMIPGQTVNVDLTLKKLTSQNVQIHMIAGANKGGFRFADGAQFNTDDQSRIDKDVKRLAEENAAHMLANPPPKRARVMH